MYFCKCNKRERNSENKDMDVQAFFKLTYGLYVVCGKFENAQSGFVSNTVMQVTADPSRVAIAVSKNNFTCELIRKSLRFTVSALKQSVSRDIISSFGYSSGRDTDKFASFGHQTTANGLPVLTQDALAWFDCLVEKALDLGTHYLFVALVVNTEVLSEGEPLTYAYYRDVMKGHSPKSAPTYIDPKAIPSDSEKSDNIIYMCSICGYEYDPAVGDPDSGIAPGTPFEDLPDDWVCPICKMAKSNFIKKE